MRMDLHHDGEKKSPFFLFTDSETIFCISLSISYINCDFFWFGLLFNMAANDNNHQPWHQTHLARTVSQRSLLNPSNSKALNKDFCVLYQDEKIRET